MAKTLGVVVEKEREYRADRRDQLSTSIQFFTERKLFYWLFKTSLMVIDIDIIQVIYFTFCRYQASYGEEEVNVLRQEVNNLKARLQRAGAPRRESPGVGAGAEEQVTKFVDLMSMILESLVRTKWLSVTGLLMLYGEEIVNSCSI